MPTPPETFRDFWPRYVLAHRHPVNRGLHYAGTAAAVGLVAFALIKIDPTWLLLAPLPGYGAAWFGHAVFEKNRPETFRHPLWSLRGDFKMALLAVQRKFGSELERFGAR